MKKSPLTPDDIRNGKRGLTLVPITLLDRSIQSRVERNESTVAEYAERMKALDGSGDPIEFPPVEVVYDVKTGVFHVVDGEHRIAAHELNGETSILCEISHTQGSREVAIEAAATANKTHGLPRTRADKEKAVRMLFELEEFRNLSDRIVAEVAGVSHPFVAKIRRELEILPVADEEPDTIEGPAQLEILPVEKPKAAPPKRKGRDGKERRVPVAQQVTTAPDSDDTPMSLEDRVLARLSNGEWLERLELSDEILPHVPKKDARQCHAVEGEGRWIVFGNVVADLQKQGKIEDRIAGDDYEYRLAPPAGADVKKGLTVPSNLIDDEPELLIRHRRTPTWKHRTFSAKQLMSLDDRLYMLEKNVDHPNDQIDFVNLRVQVKQARSALLNLLRAKPDKEVAVS